MSTKIQLVIAIGGNYPPSFPQNVNHCLSCQKLHISSACFLSLLLSNHLWKIELLAIWRSDMRGQCITCCTHSAFNWQMRGEMWTPGRLSAVWLNILWSGLILDKHWVCTIKGWDTLYVNFCFYTGNWTILVPNVKPFVIQKQILSHFWRMLNIFHGCYAFI